MEKVNLWENVGNRCLASALTLLESETAPTPATVETVRALVDTAIAIDTLNLQRERQTRYDAPTQLG